MIPFKKIIGALSLRDARDIIRKERARTGCNQDPLGRNGFILRHKRNRIGPHQDCTAINDFDIGAREIAAIGFFKPLDLTVFLDFEN